MFIYILELEHDKYYVGRTNNITTRIEQHKNGEGSAWTTMYKFKSLIRQIKSNDPFDEDKWVKKWMQQHGIDNVRGGSYVNISLDEHTIKFIEREIRGATDNCFKCGGAHFASQCGKIQTNQSKIKSINTPAKFTPKFGVLANTYDYQQFCKDQTV